ncbi:MAG: hypothetical protein ACLSVD_02445 [Eggerthellaceae bacterium]
MELSFSPCAVDTVMRYALVAFKLSTGADTSFKSAPKQVTVAVFFSMRSDDG